MSFIIERMIDELLNLGFFLPGDEVDGRADAFRHAFGMGTMTVWWGAEVAKGFGDRHEDLGRKKAFPEQQASDMDQLNNAAARRFVTGSGGSDGLFEAAALATLPGNALGGVTLYVLGPVNGTPEERVVAQYGIWAIQANRCVRDCLPSR